MINLHQCGLNECSQLANKDRCWYSLLVFSSLLLCPGKGAKYCGTRVCMPVCLSVCFFVCPLTYPKSYTSKYHQNFCTCYRWSWLGPPVTAMQYVMYFRFVDDVMFSYNGTIGPESKTICPVRKVAATGPSPTAYVPLFRIKHYTSIL